MIEKKRIAIVPARGGSKRIPQKNITLFNGRPIISYALDALAKSDLFDTIHVSTDCHDICKVVDALGYKVDFLRPPELSGDHVGIIPVLNWVLEKYQADGVGYETICCMMPAAPLIHYSDIVSACVLFEKSNRLNPLFTFSKFPAPIEWSFRVDVDGLMYPKSDSALNLRSQDIQESYYECGPFNFWSASHIKNSNPYSLGVIPYILPRDKAIDIDTPEDLLFAEQLYKLQISND